MKYISSLLLDIIIIPLKNSIKLPLLDKVIIPLKKSHALLLPTRLQVKYDQVKEVKCKQVSKGLLHG